MRPRSPRRGLCAMNDAVAMKARILRPLVAVALRATVGDFPSHGVRRLPSLLLALLLVWPVGFSCRAQNAPVGVLQKVTLDIGKANIEAEIAATPEQEERGLMFRTHLGDNDGMIFLLPKITTATFWMKNTLIPLSIAFIDKNGVILEIHDMMPMDETITRSESDHVAYALETNLHWFALNGIKPGDKLDPPPASLGKASPSTP